MLDYDEDLPSYKVVLVGESGVGKTSIISYFIYEKFNNCVTSTTSVAYLSKKMNYNNIKFKYDIWDTAGQEKYRALVQIFYTNSNVAILVYDVTNRKSFEEIKNFWYKDIQQKCPNINKFNFK